MLPNASDEEVLEVGACITLNEFQRNDAEAVKNIEKQVIGRLPSMVDNTLKRLMGIVE